MREYTHQEKTKNKHGYVLLYVPEHPRANCKRVFEHIVVWEKANNMSVPEGYVIHHKNGIKDDNRIDNLQLMTIADHVILHHTNSKRTAETKKKISEFQTERLKDKRNHPKYKDIPIEELARLVERGETVVQVCKKYNICKQTYYKKLKERGIK